MVCREFSMNANASRMKLKVKLVGQQCYANIKVGRNILCLSFVVHILSKNSNSIADKKQSSHSSEAKNILFISKEHITNITY